MNTVKFGKLESETKVEKINECRNLVNTILDCGINNEQLMVLIRLLALNLENHEHSVEISNLAKKLAVESGNSLFLIDSEGE